MARRLSTEPGNELTPVMFQILLVLAEEQAHGYAIMKEIEHRTDGAMELGAGTLYRSIRLLVDADLITEVQPRKVVHSQRRYYRITPTGRRRATTEAKRLQHLVRWAREAELLPSRRT